MNDFDENVLKLLKKPLDEKKVKKLSHGSRAQYLEGWQVLEDANKTFGFGTWSCETIYNKEVSRYSVKIGKEQKDGFKVGYEAKVRITANSISREGTGHGSGTFRDLFECIEGAAKEAETDAIKRAFRSFGNMFGLPLYDKSKKNIGNVENYDNQYSKAEIYFNKLKATFKECTSSDDLNKAWTTNVKQIASIKTIDKDGMYKELEQLFKEGRINADS